MTTDDTGRASGAGVATMVSRRILVRGPLSDERTMSDESKSTRENGNAEEKSCLAESSPTSPGHSVALLV